MIIPFLNIFFIYVKKKDMKHTVILILRLSYKLLIFNTNIQKSYNIFMSVFLIKIQVESNLIL